MSTKQIGARYDVVVVGSGAAGLAAAIEAAGAGARTAVFEKGPTFGGTTGRAIGSVTANSTRLQQRAGVEDSPQAHFEDLGVLAGPDEPKDNLELRRLYVEQIPETFQWLLDLGLEFMGPMAEHPHRVPRMHTVLPNAGAYIHQLGKRARSLGTEMFTDAKVVGLTTTGTAVTGVIVEHDGQRRNVSASAVVLASGDYSSGHELKARYLDEWKADVDGVNPLSTGDGQTMGIQAGSRVVNGELAYGPELRFVSPPRKFITQLIPGWRIVGKLSTLGLKVLPPPVFRWILMSLMTTNVAPSPRLYEEGAILVNRRGERFVDEREEPSAGVMSQPGKEAFIVFDESVASLFTQWPYAISTAPGFAYAYLKDYAGSRRDIFFREQTVSALAQRLGIPAQALQATIDSTNATRDGREGTPRPLRRGPFYALGPARAYVIMTDGGLAVDTELRVLDAEGVPIPGLYGAGSAGQGGVLLGGHGHHIGWGFVSGRIAGRNAAKATVAVGSPSRR